MRQRTAEHQAFVEPLGQPPQTRGHSHIRVRSHHQSTFPTDFYVRVRIENAQDHRQIVSNLCRGCNLRFPENDYTIPGNLSFNECGASHHHDVMDHFTRPDVNAAAADRDAIFAGRCRDLERDIG